MPIETYRRIAFLLVAAVLLAGCGGKKAPSLGAPFAYDSSKPLNLENRGAALGVKGLKIRDISFDGPDGEHVTGYLVAPLGPGKHPAVVFAHGAGGNRVELFTKAAELAQKGVVGLTLDMAYAPDRAQPLPRGIEGARARIALEEQTVIEVRRAVDVLRSLPSVDGERIGYVGWSAGARIGAVVAGVEHRIKAFDLLAGGAAPVDEYVRYAPANLKAEFRKLLDTTDPLRYVGHAAPSALFFQDGRRDEIVPRAALVALLRAGSKPKRVGWYDSGHTPGDRAWAESRSWLLHELR